MRGKNTSVIPFPSGNGEDKDQQHSSGGNSASAVAFGEECEDGNGLVFLARHRQDVLYVEDTNKWATFGDHRWSEDNKRGVRRMMLDDMRFMHGAACAMNHPSRDWYLRSWNNARIEASLKLAATDPDITARSAQFDTNPLLLGYPGGVIDLRGSIGHRKGLRQDRITKAIPTPFNAYAECKTWITFLEDIYQKDPVILDFIQRWCGYLLTGLVHEELMLVLYGNGSNGKSLLLKTIAHVMGELSGPLPLGAFDSRNSKVAHLFIAECRGRRIMLASEVSKRSEMDESRVKALTSRDTLIGRKYWQNYTSFAATHKTMFAVNHLPTLSDFTHGMLRRLAVIEHKVTFPEDDGKLERDLQSEASGILNWMLKGLLMWREHPLKPLPAIIIAEVMRYRDSHDTVGEFIETMCVVHVDKRAPRRKLYNKYLAWCAANGINGRLRLTSPEFFNDMRGRGFRDSDAGVRPFRGIGMR